jgi:hypothetical protein
MLRSVHPHLIMLHSTQTNDLHPFLEMASTDQAQVSLERASGFASTLWRATRELPGSLVNDTILGWSISGNFLNMSTTKSVRTLPTSLRTVALALMSTCSLIACGGGGGGADGSPPNAPPPPSTIVGGVNNGNAPPPRLTITQEPTLDAILADSVSGFICRTGAIACTQVASTASTAQSSVPVTFGQPFRAGDLPSGAQLIAKDDAGNVLPLQMDAVSRRPDGSVRFAVLSVQLSSVQVGERRVINLYRTSSAIQSSAQPDASTYDLTLDMRLYQPQMTLVTFGNPDGWNDGAPFQQGEVVELDLDGELHAIPITAELAGGGINNLYRLAEAFNTKINRDSTRFKAHKIGDAGAWNNLWITTRQPDGGAFTISRRPAPSSTAVISFNNHITYAAPRAMRASAGAAARNAVAQNLKAHLRGAVANEYTVVIPFKDSITSIDHPQLTARLHVRFLDGGARARTDVVIENNWAYNSAPGNYIYELTGTSAGQTVLNQPLMTHYHHARWHRVVWQGQEVLAQVRHHMPYFMSTRAVWNYNLRLTVPESVLQNEATRLANADTAPMGNAFLMPYFGTTGGREEIGPYPRWTALFLVTQDDRARRSMMANADAAAGVPVHFRDAVTDEPLDLERHPTAATFYAYNSGNVVDRFPDFVDTGTIWTPDVAHQGSFTFVPYLLTGDKFYLDEMMFWASWNLAAIAPSYRNDGEGLINDQVRAQAWGLRSLGEASRAAPDTHALKAYFESRLQNNIAWHKLHKSESGSHVSPMGLILKPDQPTISGVWQNDFVAIVLSQLVDEGYEDAKQPLDFMSRFNVGRFLNESNGYCLYRAAGNYLAIRDGSSGAFYTTWRDLFQANYADSSCASGVDPNSYPDSASAYAGYSRGMLAATYNAGLTAAPQAQSTLDALQAYRTWVNCTPLIDGAFVTHDPTWAIIPRGD